MELDHAIQESRARSVPVAIGAEIHQATGDCVLRERWFQKANSDEAKTEAAGEEVTQEETMAVIDTIRSALVSLKPGKELWVSDGDWIRVQTQREKDGDPPIALSSFIARDKDLSGRGLKLNRLAGKDAWRVVRPAR